MKRKNCEICGKYSAKRKICKECKEKYPYIESKSIYNEEGKILKKSKPFIRGELKFLGQIKQV